MDSVGRYSICVDDLEFGRSSPGHNVIGSSDCFFCCWRDPVHESRCVVFVEFWSTPIDLVNDHDDWATDVWIAIVTIHDPDAGSRVIDDYVCQSPKSRQRFRPHATVASVTRKLVHLGGNADPEIVARFSNTTKLPCHADSRLLGMRPIAPQGTRESRTIAIVGQRHRRADADVSVLRGPVARGGGRTYAHLYPRRSAWRRRRDGRRTSISSRGCTNTATGPISRGDFAGTNRPTEFPTET